jgi:hypothetical protein
MTLSLSALVTVVVMVLRCDQGIHVELPKAKVKEICCMFYVTLRKLKKYQSIHRQSETTILK